MLDVGVILIFLDCSETFCWRPSVCLPPCPLMSSTAVQQIFHIHTHTLTYIRRYYTPRYLHEYKPHYFPDLCLCLLFDLLSVGFYFFFTPHQRRSCSLQIPLYIYDPIILPLLSTPPPSPQPPPDVINLVRGPGVMS